MNDSSTQWHKDSERGSMLGIQILLWACRLLGRRATHAIALVPCIFFFLVAHSARRASRHYLQRAKSQPVRLCHVFKHFYTFTCVNIDRFYFLLDQYQKFDISVAGKEAFDAVDGQSQGALLLLSHVGSFDALRRLGDINLKSRIRLLLDSRVSPNALRVLNTLDPELAKNIIDRKNYDGPALALKLHEEVSNGHLVGIMADRIYDGENFSKLSLLGKRTHFPVGPWVLAQVLKVPVILCFGLFAGGKRYRFQFKYLDAPVGVPRAERKEVMATMQQVYVETLESVLLKYPYNWMNFYDFWQDESVDD